MPSKKINRRSPISQNILERLMTESRRRCCLCVYLKWDLNPKQVQVVHISRDRADSSYENLALLCLEHHDEYDSKRSQSKGLTSGELRFYKNNMIELISKLDKSISPIITPMNFGLQSGEEEYVIKNKPLSARMSDINEMFGLLLSNKNKAQESIFPLTKDIKEIGTISIIGSFMLKEGTPCFILLISDNFEDNWNILVYLNYEKKWWRVCNLPILGTNGAKPIIYNIYAQDFMLLGIEQRAFKGTDAHLMSVIWYRVTHDKITPLFIYPKYGYVTGWGMIFRREIFGEAYLPSYVERGSIFEISMKTKYAIDYSWLRKQKIKEEIELFEKKFSVVLKWDVDSHIFIPSDISLGAVDDIESLFNDDSESFLTRNVKELTELAKHGSPLQKKWLMDFVNDCSSSNESDIIKTILKNDNK